MKGAFAALAFLALATAASAEPTDRARYQGCVGAIGADAAKAELFGREWHARGGGVPALHCVALAEMHRHAYGRAADTLTEAAREAESKKDQTAAALWGQAGNAAFLAGGRNAEALRYFDRALAATPAADRGALGGLHVDRAEVAVAMGENAAARKDLDQATDLTPTDATAWALSAALARRDGDLARATRDIAEASKLDPADASVILEQGNIAAAKGDVSTAETIWRRAIAAAPDSEAATIARRQLAAAQ